MLAQNTAVEFDAGDGGLVIAVVTDVDKAEQTYTLQNDELGEVYDVPRRVVRKVLVTYEKVMEIAGMGGRVKVVSRYSRRVSVCLYAHVCGCAACVGVCQYAIATQDYVAQRDDELSMKKGDKIKITTQGPAGDFWVGQLGDGKGFFNSNLCTVVSKAVKKDATAAKSGAAPRTDLAAPRVSLPEVKEEGFKAGGRYMFKDSASKDKGGGGSANLAIPQDIVGFVNRRGYDDFQDIIRRQVRPTIPPSHHAHPEACNLRLSTPKRFLSARPDTSNFACLSPMSWLVHPNGPRGLCGVCGVCGVCDRSWTTQHPSKSCRRSL